MLYMYEFIISFILAFIVAFSFTPIAKKLAFKFGAIDIPKDNRRMHKKPIPLMGGLAIIVGFLVAVLFNIIMYFVDKPGIFVPDTSLFGLLGGIIIIVALGILDDIKNLSARIKFPIQIIAAIIVVSSGTVIQYVTNPFSSVGYSQLPQIVAYPVTVLWIVGITNAINLIDGLDGLAAGVSSIASLSLFFVSIIFRQWDSSIITAIIAGSTLGFLPYNFNPARIFMGDTGSTFLGFVLGVISVSGTLKAYATIAIAIPLLILGLPLFDTTFAIFRRLAKGKSIMEADRGHLHHRLIDMGLSHKQSVVVMYVASAALGLCAIALADKGVIGAIVLFMSIAVFILGGARYMTEFEKDNYELHREGKANEEEKDDSGIDELDTGESLEK